MNEKVWKRKRSLRQESRSPVTKPASQSAWHTAQTPWSVRRSADSGRVPRRPPRAVEHVEPWGVRWKCGGRGEDVGLTTLTELRENMLGDCSGSGRGSAGGGLGRGGLMPTGAASAGHLCSHTRALRQDCRQSPADERRSQDVLPEPVSL